METLVRKSPFSRLQDILSRPVSAVAVDVFRILTGLLVCVYYVRLFLEYPVYTAENGLLDHELHRRLFWFTKLTLFFPGSPDWYKILLLIVGALGSVALTLGVKPKAGAVVSWIVAVSVHRWNFAVINLDDSAITLSLWWMMFLPIGQTLTLDTWRGRSDWRKEVFWEVDGFFVRAFFANLFIYYLTAGLTKLGSELWREGLALFVVLHLPLARTNGWWSAKDLPALWCGNHFTLIVEPLLPFTVFLPKGHPLKYFMALCWIALHVTIPLTIGVPYANFGLILALTLVFQEELAGWLRRKAGEEHRLETLAWTAPRGTRSLILTYLLVLFLAMQKNVPVLEKAWEPSMAALYLGGVAQEYHLFDWIDRYNWTIKNEVTVQPDNGPPFSVNPVDLYPASVRGFIVQSYLLPMRWMRVPQPLTGEMRNSMLRMGALRLVRTHQKEFGPSGTVIVKSQVGRLDQRDLEGKHLWEVTLMKFHYHGTDVTFLYPRPGGADEG